MAVRAVLAGWAMSWQETEGQLLAAAERALAAREATAAAEACGRSTAPRPLLSPLCARLEALTGALGDAAAVGTLRRTLGLALPPGVAGLLSAGRAPPRYAKLRGVEDRQTREGVQQRACAPGMLWAMAACDRLAEEALRMWHKGRRGAATELVEGAVAAAHGERPPPEGRSVQCAAWASRVRRFISGACTLMACMYSALQGDDGEALLWAHAAVDALSPVAGVPVQRAATATEEASSSGQAAHEASSVAATAGSEMVSWLATGRREAWRAPLSRAELAGPAAAVDALAECLQATAALHNLASLQLAVQGAAVAAEAASLGDIFGNAVLPVRHAWKRQLHALHATVKQRVSVITPDAFEEVPRLWPSRAGAWPGQLSASKARAPLRRAPPVAGEVPPLSRSDITKAALALQAEADKKRRKTTPLRERREARFVAAAASPRHPLAAGASKLRRAGSRKAS